MPRVAKLALWAQGAYYVLTGAWPLVSMRAFEAVTGPKTDDWLVRMVGLLAALIGGVLLAALRSGRVTREILLLAGGAAACFGAIDLWYGLGGRISPVYVADGVLELAFMAASGLAWREQRR